MNEKEKGYTVTDRRGMESGQEHPEEVCRVCGSKEVHSKQYGKPTMECINFLQTRIQSLETEERLKAVVDDAKDNFYKK